MVELSAEEVVVLFKSPGPVEPLSSFDPAVGNRIASDEFEGSPTDGAGFSSPGKVGAEELLTVGMSFGRADGNDTSEDELCSVDELDDGSLPVTSSTPVPSGIGIGASDPVGKALDGGGDDDGGSGGLLGSEGTRSGDACAGKDCVELETGRRELARPHFGP